MTTLIAWYNSDGCIGRCDAKCHEGQQQALGNTHEMADVWLEDWQRRHPEAERIKVAGEVAQLSLL